MDLPRAVLFDFSGTLMRIEATVPWVRAVAEKDHLGLDASQVAYWADRLELAGGQAGGGTPQTVPEHLADTWANRDFDAPTHRAAYNGLVRAGGWPWEHLIDKLYDRAAVPEAWNPYPDARDALSLLKELGVKTGLVSNIAWDARHCLQRAGLLEHLDITVLSYEVGLCKPDPEIFALACKHLEVDPARTVMVGDHPFDGGGDVLGIRTHFVEHLPVDQRPTALADVVRKITQVPAAVNPATLASAAVNRATENQAAGRQDEAQPVTA